jgi:hypothetical protein
LNNLNVLYNNYNRIFKKELFISLLQFKGNTLNNNNNIVDQFSEKNKDEKKNLITLSLNDYLENKETYNFGEIKVPLINNEKHNQMYFMDCKIRKYFKFTNDDIIEDFKALVYSNSSIEKMFEKMIAVKNNKKTNDFNPICINTLIKMFNQIKDDESNQCKSISDIIDYHETIDNITINKYNLFEHNFPNANVWRKQNFIETIRIQGKGTCDNSYNFIRDANVILSDFGLVYRKISKYDVNNNEIKRPRKKIEGKLQDCREYSLELLSGDRKYSVIYKNEKGEERDYETDMLKILKEFKWLT